MDTFKDWPHESPVAVDALVRAGLFYTGESGYFLYVYVCACLPIRLCATSLHAALRGQTGCWILGLELVLAVNHHLGAETKPNFFCESSQCSQAEHLFRVSILCGPHIRILLHLPLVFIICHRSLWDSVSHSSLSIQPLNLGILQPLHPTDTFHWHRWSSYHMVLTLVSLPAFKAHGWRASISS